MLRSLCVLKIILTNKVSFITPPLKELPNKMDSWNVNIATSLTWLMPYVSKLIYLFVFGKNVFLQQDILSIDLRPIYRMERLPLRSYMTTLLLTHKQKIWLFGFCA